jgi:hypothetical protein
VVETPTVAADRAGQAGTVTRPAPRPSPAKPRDEGPETTGDTQSPTVPEVRFLAPPETA